MPIDFNPQFHKRIAQSDGRNAWVATPLPKTLIAAKTRYYRAWQRDECVRLQKAGERVVVRPVAGYRPTAEADGARSIRHERVPSYACGYR